MALSSGKYWTGDPDVKPEAWGPVEDVQAAIRENAAGMGIDPESIVLCMPMWGPGDQIDYISKKTGSTTGATFKENSLVFDGKQDNANSDRVTISNADLTTLFGSQPTSLFFSVKKTDYLKLNTITSCGTPMDGNLRWAFSDDSRSNNRMTFATLKDGTWHSVFWNSVHLPAGEDSTFVLTYNGLDTISLHISGEYKGANTVSPSWFPSITNDVILGAGNVSAVNNNFWGFEGNIYLSSFFYCDLSSSQIADLSDHPGALTLPIVRRFHSIPEGAGDVIAAACTDGFTFADSTTKTAILQATAIESINLSDSDENVAQFIAALVDSFTMADLPGNTAKYPVSVSDAFSVSDSTTALQKVIALVSDNVTFSDVSVVRADLTGIAEDNVQFSETFLATLQAQAIASEIINLSDSVNAELLSGLLAYVTDTFNMSDSTTAIADLVALITDAFDLSDAATNTLQAYATATDGFTVSDTAFWAGVTQAIASDSFTVSGSVTGLIKLLAQAAETINFSDSGSVTATYNVQVNDAVEFATAISTIAQFRAAVADGFNVTATPMEVSQLPNGKVSVSFSMKTATVVFNIK